MKEFVSYDDRNFYMPGVSYTNADTKVSETLDVIFKVHPRSDRCDSRLDIASEVTRSVQKVVSTGTMAVCSDVRRSCRCTTVWNQTTRP